MVDDLRSDDGLGGLDGHHHRPARRSEKERPLVDRLLNRPHRGRDGTGGGASSSSRAHGSLPTRS